jgi:protein subunit release factor A
MKEAVLELRAGEGGDDSCLFLRDMVRMYTAYCASQGVGMECL